MGARAQQANETLVPLAKVSFEKLTELPQWASFLDTYPDVSVRMVDEGLAITNPHVQKYSWQPQVMITADSSFDLDAGNFYIIRLILKVPSDGELVVNIDGQGTNYAYHAPVKASDDFQIIDVEYPEYQGSVKGGHVSLELGWIKGTTIIKEVEVLEKLGYWWEDIFKEMTPDASSTYKFVLPMDYESEVTLKDLLAGRQMTEDKGLVKDIGGHFYVLKDHPLPEGNYFTSDFYQMRSPKQKMQTIYVLPRILVQLNEGYQVDDILEHLGNNVILYSSEKTLNWHHLSCQVKTSEEVLKVVQILNSLYRSKKYGISYYSPYNGFAASPLTAIKTINAEKPDDTVYNLAGQKVNTPYKGIVIQNGRKMVMK